MLIIGLIAHLFCFSAPLHISASIRMQASVKIFVPIANLKPKNSIKTIGHKLNSSIIIVIFNSMI